MYLGSWAIDNLLTFPANTHAPSTGAATDADAVPAYRVYEDETGTAILTGNMAKLDDANTTGFYSEQITLSAANGFEKGKCYTVYISAAVGGVTGTMAHTFQIEAEVDANVVSDKTGYGLADNAITAAKIATDAVTELIAAVFANDLESGKTFAQAILDLWATNVGDATVDDADDPTTATYDSPDGTVQVTHTLTGTTRTNA